MRFSIALGTALSLAVIACGGTDGGPTAPQVLPVIPQSPAPPVPASPTPPKSARPLVTGKWLAAQDAAGVTNLTIDVTENPVGTFSGRWTATRVSCNCELKGDISSGGVYGTYGTDTGFFLYLMSDNSALTPYGFISGAMTDNDHISGLIEMSTETGYFGDDTIGDVLTLVRITQ